MPNIQFTWKYLLPGTIMDWISPNLLEYMSRKRARLFDKEIAETMKRYQYRSFKFQLLANNRAKAD
jgi:hypothetical protein